MANLPFTCPIPECGRAIARREGLARHAAAHALTEKLCVRCATTKCGLCVSIATERTPERKAARGFSDVDRATRGDAAQEPEEKVLFYHRHLARSFGITPEDYYALLVQQGGTCAICREPEKRLSRSGTVPRNLSVDHDHDTGLVRGLLCHDCNVAIGLLRDSPELMTAAIGYLNRSSMTNTKVG